MKKILLTLACSILLVGCVTKTSDKTKNGDPNSDNGSAENGNGDYHDYEGHEGGASGGDEGENGQNNQQNPNISTKTVTFYNGGITDSSLDKPSSQQKFVNWFNGDDDLLTSIDYLGYAQLNYIGDAKDPSRFSTLILGSSSETGNITFNFAYQVTSVKFNIQGYCKYIAYSDSYSVDTDSKFKLDDETLDLSVSAGYTGLLDRKDMIKTYETPISSFTIASEGQRVFVHTMEISYIL